MSTVLSPWDDLAIPPQARGRGVTLNLFDQLSAYVRERPGAYVRISSGRFGPEAGGDRQNDDALKSSEDISRRMDDKGGSHAGPEGRRPHCGATKVNGGSGGYDRVPSVQR